MIIFEYRVSSTCEYIGKNNERFAIRITDDVKDNVVTSFYGKKYRHTISEKDLKRIIKIINDSPEIFDIPKDLEPNDVLDGDDYSFRFSNGVRINTFSGLNILEYGRRPRKNATLALRVARRIKEEVLLDYKIRTMIPSRLQNWPRYRKASGVIKI